MAILVKLTTAAAVAFLWLQDVAAYKVSPPYPMPNATVPHAFPNTTAPHIVPNTTAPYIVPNTTVPHTVANTTVPHTVANTTVPHTTALKCMAVHPNITYDYIIIGSGPAGIVMADQLRLFGNTVLLVEKGQASTGRWGGTLKPKWLEGTNLTRFDVPGLSDWIWKDSAGVACRDSDQMTSCILGGGSATSAGLWYRPQKSDWDSNFPRGWKEDDVLWAASLAFYKIAGTIHPSMDGKVYYQGGYNVLRKGLRAGGYTYVEPNKPPRNKTLAYGYSTFMYENGEQGGPLSTYLAHAHSYNQTSITMWLNTNVRRIVRVGGHATGVELECAKTDGASGGEGRTGIVHVTPKTGRVIVSAGAFGSAKLLLRSGIGPQDQLEMVSRSEADRWSMIPKKDWINLPVGYNLHDRVSTDIELSHPNIVQYNYTAAWHNPRPRDAQAYLVNRTGILTQGAPNLGPTFWEAIRGNDNITRYLQWQARIEGSTSTSMTIRQYLGLGAVSRGRMTIDKNLKTIVSTSPYLHNDHDKEAVIQGMANLVKILSEVEGLKWIRPAVNQTAADYVNKYSKAIVDRRAHAWGGTIKMGLDDGRQGGSSVVDTNTRVYGTDNIFVVDSSIIPGPMSVDPMAAIVIMAEHAAYKVQELPRPNNTSISGTPIITATMPRALPYKFRHL